MSLWFFLGLMTLAAVLAVLWPLARRPSAVAAGNEVAVYRDQLAELERQTGTGLFAAGELQAARAEIGRRLLAAADAAAAPQAKPAPAAATFRRRAVAVAALLLLPAVAVGLYAKLGSPHLPGQPLAARETPPLQDRSLESLVAQVETRLESHPEDGRGWEVIAPIYLRLGRYEDAVKARRNALRLNGASAQRESDLGEALVYAAGGVVTQEAKDAFERALALDPKEPKARYFTGLAAEQDGDRTKAAEIWRALLADAAPDAPYAELVRRALSRVGGAPAAGGPSAEEVDAAGDMTPEARQAMIRGMVERLATRLAGEGGDVEGWLRLVRAYMVLGEPQKARAAAEEARRALAAEPEKLRRINDLVKSLGLDT